MGQWDIFILLFQTFIKYIEKQNVKIKIYKIKEMFEISRRKCPIVSKGSNVLGEKPFAQKSIHGWNNNGTFLFSYFKHL